MNLSSDLKQRFFSRLAVIFARVNLLMGSGDGQAGEGVEHGKSGEVGVDEVGGLKNSGRLCWKSKR